jgi:hypothetical protein
MEQQQRREVNEAAEEFADAVRDSYRVVTDRAASAQHLNAELTQNFFNSVINNLHAQAEGARQITKELADQQERQREVTQALTQESVGAYMDFVNSLFSYYQEASEQVKREVASTKRSEEAIQLLEEWLADESGYDEEAWPELKAALERDRLSDRKLFVD